jgi:hypothetical protein
MLSAITPAGCALHRSGFSEPFISNYLDNKRSAHPSHTYWMRWLHCGSQG